jgi:hypothetical protein
MKRQYNDNAAGNIPTHWQFSTVSSSPLYPWRHFKIRLWRSNPIVQFTSLQHNKLKLILKLIPPQTFSFLQTPHYKLVINCSCSKEWNWKSESKHEIQSNPDTAHHHLTSMKIGKKKNTPLVHKISFYRQPLITATACGEESVVLYQDLSVYWIR